MGDSIVGICTWAGSHCTRRRVKAWAVSHQSLW